MTNRVSPVESAYNARKTAIQIGFWIAILTAVFTAVAFVIAIATPPISGPFCQSGCIAYPYTNVVSHIPHDYIWLYPAIFIAPLFLILAVCIHYYAPSGKKIFGQIGLSFAVIYAAVVTTDYYIQLTVIQPSLLRGEKDGLALFLQYNPHGIFIALEDLGYLMMSIAFFFVARIFLGDERIERVLRWLFTTGSLLAIGLYIVLSAIYGNNLEYRFEVMIITINWMVLIVAGISLSILFKRTLQQTASV